MYTFTPALQVYILRKARLFALILCLILSGHALHVAHANPAISDHLQFLPAPGELVLPTDALSQPVIMNGIVLDPSNPLAIEFLIDPGETAKSQHLFEQRAQKIIQYFYAAMTIPADHLWVNLSPYERNRIIPEKLSQTALGRDLLAQDYILKQLSASLIYPENEFGAKFWHRVHQQAQEKFGTTDIPIDTFNKIWIVPQEASVYIKDQTVLVSKSRLKVMMEEDYLALEHNSGSKSTSSIKSSNDSAHRLSTRIIKEILLPEIEREVNEGKHFAPLRQIYHSLILATWYKQNLKNSILGTIYADKNNISGIDLANKSYREDIYLQYVQAFERGVFNYIKEDQDPVSHETIPRHYFSGGVDIASLNVNTSADSAQLTELMQQPHRRVKSQSLIAFNSDGQVSDRAMQSVPGLDNVRTIPAEINASEIYVANNYQPDGIPISIYSGFMDQAITIFADRESDEIVRIMTSKRKEIRDYTWIYNDHQQRIGLLVGSKTTGSHFAEGDALFKINGWMNLPIEYKNGKAQIRIGPYRTGSTRFVTILNKVMDSPELSIRFEHGWPIAVQLPDGSINPIPLIRNQQNKPVKASWGKSTFHREDRWAAFAFENFPVSPIGEVYAGAQREMAYAGYQYASFLMDNGVRISVDGFNSPRYKIYDSILRTPEGTIVAAAFREPVDSDHTSQNLVISRHLEDYAPLFSNKLEDPSNYQVDTYITGRSVPSSGMIRIGEELRYGIGIQHAGQPIDIVMLPSIGKVIIDVITDENNVASVYDLKNRQRVSTEDLESVNEFLTKHQLEWLLDPTVKQQRTQLYKSLTSPEQRTLHGLKLFSSRLIDLKRVKRHLTVQEKLVESLKSKQFRPSPNLSVSDQDAKGLLAKMSDAERERYLTEFGVDAEWLQGLKRDYHSITVREGSRVISLWMTFPEDAVVPNERVIHLTMRDLNGQVLKTAVIYPTREDHIVEILSDPNAPLSPRFELLLSMMNPEQQTPFISEYGSFHIYQDNLQHYWAPYMFTRALDRGLSPYMAFKEAVHQTRLLSKNKPVSLSLVESILSKAGYEDVGYRHTLAYEEYLNKNGIFLSEPEQSDRMSMKEVLQLVEARIGEQTWEHNVLLRLLSHYGYQVDVTFEPQAISKEYYTRTLYQKGILTAPEYKLLRRVALAKQTQIHRKTKDSFESSYRELLFKMSQVDTRYDLTYDFLLGMPTELQALSDQAMTAVEVGPNVETINNNLRSLSLSGLFDVAIVDGEVDFQFLAHSYEIEERTRMFAALANPNLAQQVFANIEFTDEGQRLSATMSLYRVMFQAYSPLDFQNPHQEFIDLMNSKNNSYLYNHPEVLRLLGNDQDNQFTSFLQDWLKQHATKNPMLKEPRVLVIGAGSGQSIRHIKGVYPASQITALDVDPEVFNKLETSNLDAEIVLGDAQKMPFTQGSFDLIIVEGVIRYVAMSEGESLSMFARELERVASTDAVTLIHDHVDQALMQEMSSHFSSSDTRIDLDGYESRFHRHTMFYIMMYEYFVKKNYAFREIIDALIVDSTNQNEIIQFMYEAAGYIVDTTFVMEITHSENAQQEMGVFDGVNIRNLLDDEDKEFLDLLGINVNRMIALPEEIKLTNIESDTPYKNIIIRGSGGLGVPGEKSQYYSYQLISGNTSLGSVTFSVYDQSIVIQVVGISEQGEGVGTTLFNWLAQTAKNFDRRLSIYTGSLAAARSIQKVLDNVLINNTPLQSDDIRQHPGILSWSSRGTEFQITGDPRPIQSINFDQGQVDQAQVGGIDLNPKLFHITTDNNSDQIDFPKVNPNLYPVQSIEAVIPIIIQIQPIPNLFSIIGQLNSQPNQEELLSDDVKISRQIL